MKAFAARMLSVSLLVAIPHVSNAKEYYRYVGEPGEGQMLLDPTDINYGDDSSQYSYDGECDDPRFKGGGAAKVLLASDRGRDASDCRSLHTSGQVAYAASPVLASMKTHLVMVEPAHEFCDNPDGLAFNLVVQNGSEETVQVSTDSIGISYGYVAHSVPNAEEVQAILEQRARRQKRTQWIVGAIGAAAEVSVAADTGIYTGDVLRMTLTSSSAIDANVSAALDRYRNTILEPKSLAPGETHGGWVMAGDNAFGDGYKFRKKFALVDTYVTVTVGGEQHSFTFGCEL